MRIGIRAILLLLVVVTVLANPAAPQDVPGGERQPVPPLGPARGGERVRQWLLRDPEQQPTGTARIRGRVVAADTGAPLRRVLITAVATDIRVTRMTSTDAGGRYDLKDLPAGRYTVTASKAGFVSLAFGQRRPFEPGRPLELAEGQLLDGVEFVLPRGSVITGRIVDEFGDPVAGVAVQALASRFVRDQRRLVPAGTAQTNDLGQYRIFGLPPGDYYVTASVRGPLLGRILGVESDQPTGYAPTYFPGTPNPADAQRVTVGLAQEVGNIDFALLTTRTVRIGGTVVDSQGRPSSGAIVWLLPARPDAAATGPRSAGRVRPDGTFLLTDVVPGEYVLRALAAGATDESREFAIVPLSVGSDDLSGLVITTGPGATMSGRIVLEGGLQATFRPDAVRVTLVSTAPGVDLLPGGGAGRVASDWTFRLRGLPAGPYLVRAGGFPPEWSLKAVRVSGLDVTDSPLEVKGDEEVGDVEIVLTSRTTEVNGTATGEGGRAVTDYAVLLFADSAARWGVQSRFVRLARSDQEGRFRVRGLPPETYLAVAVEGVAEGEWTDPAFLERLRPLGLRFTLNEGETKTLALKLVAVP